MKFLHDHGHSLREAQEQFGVNYRTLSRYIKARQTNPANTSSGYAMPGKARTDNFEDFAKYAKKASQIFYGVIYFDLRELAYRIGIANNVPMPQSWISNALSLRFFYDFVNFTITSDKNVSVVM